jgi:hypothetical protein
MGLTIRTLTDHLASKGIPLDRIPGCVRDLGYIVAEKPSAIPQEIDEEMRKRGWEQLRVDESTIFLILLIVAETLMEAEPSRRMWFETPAEDLGEEHPVA